eukprot:CAMPEP_0176498840 /NCGR_PEP_ID=MMETSP0200_2-20121128/12570_1 /TAXON_ID=947934 /ORGANISM="Chaetoceros sp., Strain GSL56" /LENGTH=162 /DNA_ID=CAMNT_0017897143 /DNA_START=351 /DNA_END=836 /DNA_ORIENTATION=-
MHVYTGVPLVADCQDDNRNVNSNHSRCEGTVQPPHPCPSITYIQDTDDEEANIDEQEAGCVLAEKSMDKYASFTLQWWRTLVAIMVSINTLATHYLVQDEIKGYLEAGNVHTLLEMVALFYIIQSPGVIVLYFLFNHREDFPHGACDLFNFFVFLVTVLQNW